MRKTLFAILLVLLVFSTLSGCSDAVERTETTRGFSKKPASLESIHITPTNPTIVVGNTLQLTATGIFSDLTTKDFTTIVTWSSDNTSVVTVSNAYGTKGLATSVAKGSSVTVSAIHLSTGISGNTVLNVTPAVWLSTIGPGENSFGAQDIVVDASGNSYIAGTTNSAFTGYTNFGYSDAFVAKISKGGTRLWVTQFGTDDLDEAWGIALDSSGQIYVVGRSWGDIDNDTTTGGMFISKYDNNGNLIWIKQYPEVSFGRDIEVDASGNIFAVGGTYGIVDGKTPVGRAGVFARFSTTGVMQWAQLIDSTKSDYAISLTVDGLGYIGVTGYTTGDLNNTGKLDTATDTDYYTAKYDTLGARVWIEQIDSTNTASDYGLSIDSDVNGNYYVTGYTMGNLFQTAQSWDIIYIKYSNSIVTADRIISRQIAGSSLDAGQSIFVLDEDNVFIGGMTYSDFENKGISSSLWDMVVFHLDINGDAQNVYQRYRETGGRVNGIYADKNLNFYGAGYHDVNNDIYVFRAFNNINNL